MPSTIITHTKIHALKTQRTEFEDECAADHPFSIKLLQHAYQHLTHMSIDQSGRSHIDFIKGTRKIKSTLYQRRISCLKLYQCQKVRMVLESLIC